MPIDKLTTHLEAYPRGREYSYMVTLTGSPYAWDDGKAEWDAPSQSSLLGMSVIHGGLASTDWTFDFNADPMDPLNVGGGLTVELLDEPSRRTRMFFAPNYDGGTYTRLTDTASASLAATALTVLDSTGWADGDVGYIGLETVVLSATPPSATSITANRGCFGSPYREHRVQRANDGGTVGPRMSKSPRTHRGRFLQIWIAPIEDDGGLGDADGFSTSNRVPVWAGRVSAVEFTDGRIRISCEHLLSGLTRDDWPPPLPTGSFRSDTPEFYLRDSDLSINFRVWVDDATTPTNENFSVRLGYMSTTGATYAALDELPNTDGYFTLQQIARYLSDTIMYQLYTLGLGETTTADTDLYNNFSVSVVQGEKEDEVKMAVRNDTTAHIYMDFRSPLFIALSQAARRGTDSSGPDDFLFDTLVFSNKVIHIGAGDTFIEYIPDNPADRLFPEGCISDPQYPGYVGYARIYNGENFELISFTGEEAGFSAETGRRKLTGVKRGLGGTRAQAWGSNYGLSEGDALSADKATKIAQVWMVDSEQSKGVEWFILAILTAGSSTRGDFRNAGWDYLGPRLALGLPDDMILGESIRDTVRALGLDSPRAFWVAEPKKGKEALASFMQANGLYFVAKRFTLSESQKGVDSSRYHYFGVTVASVDTASRSSYQREVTDADRTAGTTVSTDFNERLIVNSVRLAPYYYYNKSADDVGGFVYAHAEESIADHGAAKTLEIKPTALYALVSAGGTMYGEGADKYTALATKIGLRWFGAYANGPYMMTMEAPHTGWRYQPGMPVQITLAGVVSPEGDDDMTSLPGKIMDVKHRHGGTRQGATINIRLTWGDGPVELAPCVRATAHSGGTSLTIAPQVYSNYDQLLPFAEQTDEDTVDSHWFEKDALTGYKVWCWELGDYAGGEEKEVTSVTHGITFSTIVLGSALSAGLQTAATNDRLVLTFPEYANATTRQKLFAYAGSNAHPSLLDGTDTTADWL